ncbi:MAG TPA: hypothetical protein DEQ40_09110 [Oxalobacteraceae bacterium]|jgi:hypothetical protein|nr:hypothetical protein [Oxalobacteraceae bacterium]
MTASRKFTFARDRAHTHVEFCTVKATLANITDGAVLLSNEALTAPVWVPRQALDAASRALIYRSARGQEVELRVELKLALSKELV